MRRQVDRSQRSVQVSLPAPVGGWNARDALAAMPATDAVTLTNLFPRPDRIQSRGGSAIWSTGMSGNVDTLLEYNSATSRKMLAAASGSFFDVTSTGAVGAALATGLSSAPWQATMITTIGGAFLAMVNGTDAYRTYDGAVIAVQALSGVTAANLINVNLYRHRLFFCEKNTLKAWYLGLNSISGVAQALDFGSLCKRGGSLMAMGTWTTDGGEGGSDDMAVFITTEGEVLVFNGSDPSTAGAFQLIGIFQVARPLGRRCLMKYGSDLVMILEDGVYTASQVLNTGVTNPALALSDKIRGAFADAAAVYGSIFGWEATYLPLYQRLIVNVPQNIGGTTYAQYVMNSIRPAWCPYSGLNARTWCSFNGVPYFGDISGRVWKAETGSMDNGVAIAVDARQAFSDLQIPGRNKHVKMARARVQTTMTRSNVVLDADVDYNLTALSATAAPAPGALWNVALWNVSLWGGASLIISDWQTLGAYGAAIAPRFAAQINGVLTWYGTDLLVEAQNGSVM